MNRRLLGGKSGGSNPGGGGLISSCRCGGPPGGFSPYRAIIEYSSDELSVQRMPGLVRDDQRLQRTPHQSKIADQIERLVAAKFVWKAQRSVQDGVVVHHHCVVERAAANQAHSA